MTHQTFQDAIVVGSSFSGLLTACALSKHATNIHIFERDPLTPGNQPRKGVPQSKHTHVLLQSGAQLIESMIPGTLQLLLDQGGHTFDFTQKAAWFNHGSWKPQHISNFKVHLQSRPLLEATVRSQVQKIPNIHFHPQKTVTDFLFDPQRQAIHGVEFAPSRQSPYKEYRHADLVVDATGRASSMIRKLKRWSFGEVPKSTIRANLQYATRTFQAPKSGTHPWDMMVLYHTPPLQTRAGMVLPIEGDRWQVTLFGYHGDHPPSDLDGFMAFAKSLAQPDLYHAICDLKPLDEGATHRFPYAQRLHFEKLRHLPQGLIATGDAVCSFDPVFGQGVTMAATAAKLLETLLEQQSFSPKRFHKMLSRKHSLPWLFASIEDFRYAETKGYRMPGLSMMQNYVSRVMRAASKDEKVYQSVIGAFHLVESPLALVSPRVLSQALLA